MTIYWSMLLVTSILGIFSYYMPRPQSKTTDKKPQRTRLFFGIVTFGYIIIIAGLRSGFGDTPIYIAEFELYPSQNVIEIFSNTDYSIDGFGFDIIGSLFKNYISEDYHAWLFTLTAISGLCCLKTIYKYSNDFPLSSYLFMTMGFYTWFMNGTRQFLAVCILMAFFEWIIEKKTIKYLILILFVYTIHQSALLWLPVLFIVQSRPIFNKRVFVFLALTVIAVIFANETTEIFAALDDNNQDILETEGSSFLRVIISAVPCVIALLRIDRIKKLKNPVLDLLVNLAVVTMAFYLIASFTSGIYMGRIPVYFEVYNVILIPWLIKVCLDKREQAIVYAGTIGGYLYYFYISMPGPYDYFSDIIKFY